MHKKTILILLTLTISGLFRISTKISEAHPVSELKTDSIVTATISVVGDLMCHSTQFNYAKVSTDSFNFDPVYREIKKYLSESDLTFGNLETVTAGRDAGYSGYPNFNTPDSYLYALKNAGFDFLVTSNNHSLDRGEKGILKTLEKIRKLGLGSTGTFTSQKDRDSIRIIVLNGIKIAILAYTASTNGKPIPGGKKYLINMLDLDLIREDIQSAKYNGADLVLVHYHYGSEYIREPNNHQKLVVDKTIDFGADIVIGGHPHVIQPIIKFKSNSASLDSGVAAYSMGNFISNQRKRFRDAGLILNLSISKKINTDSVFLSDVTYIPTYVFRGNTKNGREFIILPAEIAFSDNPPSYLSNSDLIEMKQTFKDTREIVTRYGFTPNISPAKKDEKKIIGDSLSVRGFEPVKLQ